MIIKAILKDFQAMAPFCQKRLIFATKAIIIEKNSNEGV